MTRRRGKRRDRVYGRPPGSPFGQPWPDPRAAAEGYARALEYFVRHIEARLAREHAADLARWQDDGGR